MTRRLPLSLQRRPHVIVLNHHDVLSHPQASILRHRAATLRQLAIDLERQPVLHLADQVCLADNPHVRLRAALLARNAHQLHEAAERLRQRALWMARRADEFDAANRRSGAA